MTTQLNIDTDINSLNISARITARGADSTVPDRDDAVDADILSEDAVVGSCTLLKDHSGYHAVWGGDPSMWADNALLEWMGDLISDVAPHIEAAVQSAI